MPPLPTVVLLLAPVVCFFAFIHLPGGIQAGDDCTVCPELTVIEATLDKLICEKDIAESCAPGIYSCAGPAKLVESCDKACHHAEYFSKKNYTMSVFCDDKKTAKRPSGVLVKRS